jgi:ABC-type multidrug transport system permease subunit
VNTLGALLSKDLRRAWRNPIAFAIHLALPVLITALIGMVFSGGGAGGGGGLGRIQLAVVDEDDSVVTRFLRGALNQGEASRYLQAVVLSRDEALARVRDDQLSAVVILPRGFTRDYVLGDQTLAIELIKNPARSFHPAVVEELMGVLVTTLNAVARNFRPELSAWKMAFERAERLSPREWGLLAEQTGTRLESVGDHLFPPRVWVTKARQSAEPVEPARPMGNVFGYLLPGLAAMFLLFIADNAIRDLYREERFRTLDRYRTLRAGLVLFVAAKGLYAMVILVLSAVILFGGGALIFGIQWSQPGVLALLVLAYAVFGAGFMSLVSALAGTERRADMFNTMAAMGMGLAGGCMFPREQLPALLRDHLTPLMPTHWFASAVRGLAGVSGDPAWGLPALGLAGLGAGLVVIAAWLFERRLRQGLKG